jgi:hypothetical protein
MAPPQYALPAYYTTAKIESFVTRLCDVVVSRLVAELPAILAQEATSSCSKVIPSLEPQAPTAEPQLEPQLPSSSRRRQRRSAKLNIVELSPVESARTKNLPRAQPALKIDVTACRMQPRPPQHSSSGLRHRLQANNTIQLSAEEAFGYAANAMPIYHALGGLVPVPLRDTG